MRTCKQSLPTAVRFAKKLAPGPVNSLCKLLQEMYLSRSLDSNFLSCSNARNRCSRAFALCNQIRGQQRARSAKTSFTVHSHRPLCCTLLRDKTYELLRLLERRCAAIGNRQTKK